MLFAWDKAAGMHLYKGEKPREEKRETQGKGNWYALPVIFLDGRHILPI